MVSMLLFVPVLKKSAPQLFSQIQGFRLSHLLAWASISFKLAECTGKPVG